MIFLTVVGGLLGMAFLAAVGFIFLDYVRVKLNKKIEEKKK